MTTVIKFIVVIVILLFFGAIAVSIVQMIDDYSEWRKSSKERREYMDSEDFKKQMENIWSRSYIHKEEEEEHEQDEVLSSMQKLSFDDRGMSTEAKEGICESKED